MKPNPATFAIRAVCHLFSVLLISPAFGETGEHESAIGHEIKHDYHRNVVAGFVGYTGENRRENGSTLGIGYLRRVSDTFSIGFLAERTYGDLDFWVYAVPFAYRKRRWSFFLAPGVEDSDHHGSEFLVRVGGEYAFEVGNWEIAPQLSIDFVNGEQLGVLGIVIGKGF